MNELDYFEFDWIMIKMNWTLIALNRTVSLKCLEMTLVLIWRFINKTELNFEQVCSEACFSLGLADSAVRLQ